MTLAVACPSLLRFSGLEGRLPMSSAHPLLHRVTHPLLHRVTMGEHLREEAQASRKTDPEPAEWREESYVLSHSLLVPPCNQPLYYLQVRACQGPTAGSPPLFSGDKSPLPSYLRTTWWPPVLTSQKRVSLHKKSSLLNLS